MSAEDRLAIQQLNYEYAYYVDVFDIESWLSVFTEDAFFDEREFDSGLHVGHDAIRRYGEQIVATTQFAVHLMTNHIIRDLTETTATGTAFALVEGQSKQGDRARYQVMYEDAYRKVDGRWKIARRVLRKTFPVETVSGAAS
jgi:ketosteroid isomerase-like protein